MRMDIGLSDLRLANDDQGATPAPPRPLGRPHGEVPAVGQVLSGGSLRSVPVSGHRRWVRRRHAVKEARSHEQPRIV